LIFPFSYSFHHSVAYPPKPAGVTLPELLARHALLDFSGG
jgi:hypothetical protein